MDCSNPVNVNTKVSIGQLRARNARLVKQDLNFVEYQARHATRVEFPQLPKLEYSQIELRGLDGIVKRHAQKYLSVFDHDCVSSDVLAECFEILQPMPTCGIMVDGVPVHPTNVCEKNGKVFTNLLFGPSAFPRDLINTVGDVLPLQELETLLYDIKWYSRGTNTGLCKRLAMQMSRPCKPSVSSYREFKRILDRTLGPSLDLLPDWNMDVYEAVETIKTSFVSSAGAPYWRPKSQVVDAMMDGILPMIIDAYVNNERNQLYRQNPELFLVAIKNKDDRYEDPREKTRPYCSLPWHFQALFSVLCQPFCKSLSLFFENPAFLRNAYGFSFANGGGDKLHDFATSTTEGEIRYCVYGDDVDLFYRFNGVLYQVCPDFKQMDGSVDKRTIDFTIDYICDSFEKKHGESPFWRNICEEWKVMASDPTFVIHGENVYRKKREDGLMTGVVGTTLFDTVKSILAYEDFITHLEARRRVGGAMKFLDEDFVKKFFLENHGLVIKEGTWNPTPYNEDPDHIGEITELKFLGQALTRHAWDKGSVVAPSLGFTDWMHLLLTPKKRGKDSRLIQDRYTFDRLRGLLVTGGALNDRFYRVCNYLLSTIPNLAICMAVQEGDGKGAAIIEGHALPEDFEFQNSSGWPTYEWVVNLYASPENKLSKYKDLVPIFETPIEVVPAKDREVPRVLAIENVGKSPATALCFVKDDHADPVVKDFDGLLSTAAKLDDLEREFNKISKQLNIKPSTGDVVEAKFVPTLEEQFTALTEKAHLVLDKCSKEYVLSLKTAPPLYLKSLLKIQNTQMLDIETQYILSLGRAIQEDELTEQTILNIHTIWYVEELATKMGQPARKVVKIARDLGFFVYGPPRFQMISRGLVAPVNKKILKTFEKQAEENLENFNRVKEEIKDTPIAKDNVRKIEKLKVVKKSLAEAVKAQVEDPAIMPVPDIFLDFPSRLKPVRGYEVAKLEEGGLDYIAQQTAAHAILSGNGLNYRRFQRKGPEPLSVFEIDGIPVYETSRKMGREVFLDFYNHVIRSYILQNREIKPFPEAQHKLKEASSDWVDAVVQEEAQKVRVFLEHGKPLFVQLDKDHNIVPVDVEDPRWTIQDDSLAIAVDESGKNIQKFSGRRKTMEMVAYKLSKALSSEIKGRALTQQELFSEYSYLSHLIDPDKIKAHIEAKKNKIVSKALSQNAAQKVKSKSKSKPKEEGASRSKSGSAERKEQPKYKQKGSQAQGIHAQSGYQTSHSNGGVRLPRDYSHESERQDWPNKRANQLQSRGVGRYSGTSRSPTLATLQAEISRLRNNIERIQNDGRPVRRSMERRL